MHIESLMVIDTIMPFCKRIGDKMLIVLLRLPYVYIIEHVHM